MIRSAIIPLLACAAALPAADAAGTRKDAKLGQVLGRQVIDAGHVLEARAVPGRPGEVLIRWGDVDNVIGKGAGKGSAFAWGGSVTGYDVTLVKTVAFEDGSKGASGKGDHGKAHQDRLTGTGHSVSWETRTTTAWDGVVVKTASGSSLKIVSGPASLTVTAL